MEVISNDRGREKKKTGRRKKKKLKLKKTDVVFGSCRLPYRNVSPPARRYDRIMHLCTSSLRRSIIKG